MDRRPQLHELLKSIPGVTQAYFQPPPDVQMTYPCIVYSRAARRTEFADNAPYLDRKKYSVTVIDREADSDIPESIAALPLCAFDRHFTAEDLNHDVFNLFF